MTFGKVEVEVVIIMFRKENAKRFQDLYRGKVMIKSLDSTTIVTTS